MSTKATSPRIHRGRAVAEAQAAGGNGQATPGEARDELKAVSRWFRDLPREKKAAIRELHRIRPAYNGIALLFVLIWIAAATLMQLFPYWPVRLAGYVLIGFNIHGLANLMHEGIHGNFTRKSRLERGFAFLFGAPAFVSASAFRIIHLKHHQYNRSANDPDEITNTTRRPWLLQLAFYAWLCIGMFYYVLIRLPFQAFRLGTVGEKKRVALEYVLLAALYVSVFWIAAHYGFTDVVLHSWIYPALFTGLFANLRSTAEHMLTVPGHPLTQSRTVTSNKALSFLNVNLNYHLEHHLFPGVPWYHLPKLHALLRPEYQKAGAIVYSSYLRFLYDAFRTGVHGVARQHSSIAPQPQHVSR